MNDPPRYQGLMAWGPRSTDPAAPTASAGIPVASATPGMGNAVTSEPPQLALIDDDHSVRESLPDLLREFGYGVTVYDSAEAFLARADPTRTRALVLDIAMPGMSGIDLKQELERRGFMIPVVFITASGDDLLRQRVLREGAIAWLCKPFSDAALLDAIQAALGEQE